MAVNVGSVACDMLHGGGSVPDLKTRTQTWQVPGLNGYGVQDLGTGDSPFALVAIKYDTAANIETWFSSLEALQGAIVSAEDDWGTTHSKLLVRSVRRMAKDACIYEGNSRVRGMVAISGLVTA